MQIKMTVTYGQGFLPTLPMFANMGLAKIDVTPDKIVKLQDELLKLNRDKKLVKPEDFRVAFLELSSGFAALAAK